MSPLTPRPWRVTHEPIRTALCLLVLALAGAQPAAAQIVFQNPDFESQILVEGLDLPTAVGLGAGRAPVRRREEGRAQGAEPGRAGCGGGARPDRDRGRRGRPRDARAWRWTPPTRPTTTSTSCTRATPAWSPTTPGRWSPSSPATRSRPPTRSPAGTVILGTHVPASGGCPPPDNALDCIPSDSETHSIGSVRAAADGTLWVSSGDGADYGGVDPLAFRSYDERTSAGKIMHVDRERPRARRPPLLPRRRRPDARVHQAVRQGLPQPVPLPAAAGRAGGRRRGLEHPRGGGPPALRPAGQELRLAVLRGHHPHPRLRGHPRVRRRVRQAARHPSGARPRLPAEPGRRRARRARLHGHQLSGPVPGQALLR